MRILFAGSPAIAVPSLAALSQMECGGLDFQVAGVLTNPDSAKGRKGIALPTEVSAAAVALSEERRQKGFPPLAQIKFDRVDGSARGQIASLKCDLLVCFAFGCIFGPKCLSLFSLGGINVHPSLLPRYRGPTPIPAAILAGDRETGVSIQKIALECDCGDILAQEKVFLNGRETTASLSIIAAAKAAGMLPSVLKGIASGTIAAVPQMGEPVYTSMISREQGRIDWESGAVQIDAMIRAYNPWPLCYTRLGGEDLYILEASVVESEYTGKAAGTILGIDRNHGILVQTGDGVLAVTVLQRQAKKALDWKSFLNGARDFIGSRLE